MRPAGRRLTAAVGGGAPPLPVGAHCARRPYRPRCGRCCCFAPHALPM